MTHRIEGWCIIDSRDGSRWGGLYESESGAKSSFWNWSKWLYETDEYSKEVNAMFDSLEFPGTLVMQRPKWKIKIRPQKPYYRQKEKY